ncbi:MAG TPA: cobalamin-dependent protein, partial [Thermoanaerobaculia bacterium]
MKIAFVKPPVGGILGLEMLTFVEPLGPICVAACLESEGHECKVFDLRIDGEEHGLDLCKRFAPDVVGLQCNFTTERNRTVRLAQRIKRENPGVFVVVGGHDASRDPNWFHHEVIDAVAVGDGEEVMPPMVDAIQRGHDLATIPGLML